jgi:hypothetical protein
MRVPDETSHAAMSGKPSRKPIHESLHPHGVDRFCPVTVSRSWSAIGKAGLLAFGSIYFPRLPVSEFNETVAVADFVPDHSGGTTPDLHGIPSYSHGHLATIFSDPIGGNCQSPFRGWR